MYLSYLAFPIFTFVAIHLRELSDGENQKVMFVSFKSKRNPINYLFLSHFTLKKSES